MTTNLFEQLRTDLSSGGTGAVLDRLITQLREEKKHHELFEALKMQTRRNLGLPLLYDDVADDLDDTTSKQLEEGLIAACREVGGALLSQGQVREGWMYMRPVGDKASVAKVLSDIEVDDDNMDEIVEVALHEGVDPERGYQLVLENYGTCNAITTMEQAQHQLSKPDQQKVATLLLKHVHEELTATVIADVAQQEGADPPEKTLRDLVADRDWLFGEHSYHIDTTHLASTVRFARVLTDEACLRLAIDLTEYGRRLHEQFQYQGDEPFADLYASHGLYFHALLDEQVDEAVAYFKEKAETIDPAEIGAMSIEVYVDLLAKRGRNDEAIDALISLMPEGVHSVGYAPSLLELSEKAGNYDQLLAYYEKHDNLLGFATGLAYSGTSV